MTDNSTPDDSEITGSYRGTTRNMVKAGTKNGVAVLECQHCGKRVPRNYGNAKRHTCGDGADDSDYQCCDDMTLTDIWVEHDSSDHAGTFKERRKECTSCGEQFRLSELPNHS